MRKGFAILLLLIFLITSSTVVARPASDTSENSWKSKTPMQVPRAGLGVAVVNGRIYAIGGFNWTYLNVNEEYNPATDTWTTRESMPTARTEFGIAVFQNKIYVIGGATGELDQTGVTGVTEVYDPATDSWERKAPMPTPRQGFDANVVDGKIYTIGGFRYVKQPSGVSIQEFNLNEVYDPATDTWTTKAPLPTAVHDYASAVVNNKIYVIGGSGTNLTQIYAPISDTWVNGAPISTYSIYGWDYGAGAATTGIMAPKRIYVLGGGSLVSNNFNRIYDPERDVWSTGAPMLSPRSGFGVAVMDDVLYAIGGSAEQAGRWTGANEQYLPIGYGTDAPHVSILSPENRTYSVNNIPLSFTVNEHASWMGYSLDGKNNVTVAGNTTLSELSGGLHNVTVYARDEFGNVGVSETVWFSVAEPFPAALVAGVSGASVAVVGLGLLVYFKKRKHAEATGKTG